MGDSGEFLARSGWPRGRVGAIAAALVGCLLAVGVFGGALDNTPAAARPDAGKVAGGAPDDAPQPAPTPAPTPTFEALAPKAAPAAVSLAAVPAPPPTKRAPSTRSGGGGSTGGGGGSGGTESSDVLALTNAERANAGVGGLSRNGTLVSLACTWAAQMAASGNFSHSGFPGGFRAWGENIAAGYGSASAVVAGWMGSAGHKANILNGGYTQMGACYADSASGKRYWVQQFGA